MTDIEDLEKAEGDYNIVGDDDDDERSTVEEDYADEESEEPEEEVEIVEYVDIVDEGYFSPSLCLLILLVLLIVGVGVGIGYGVDYAKDRLEDKDKSPSPSSVPSLTPSASPSVVPSLAPSDEVFVCPICPDGNITLPDGVLRTGLLPTMTCSEMDDLASVGNITEGQCNLLQMFSQDPCGCTGAVGNTTICSACEAGGVRNQTGVVDFEVATVSCEAVEGWLQLVPIPEDSCATIQQLTAQSCDCGEVDDEDKPVYVCPICESGVVRNASGVVLVGTVETISCGELETASALGQIPEDQCGALQLAAVEVCDCGPSEADTEILQYLSSVVGDRIFLEGTSAYIAARYLLYQDPRFNEVQRRRRRNMQDVDTGDDTMTNTTQDDEVVTSNPTLNSTDIISLEDLSNEEILQRYLVILLYFLTTSNRTLPWETGCAAVELLAESRRQLEEDDVLCEFGDNETASIWLSAASECDWAGVTCDDISNQITALSLSGFGLMGSLPTEILALPSLVRIDFSQNEFEKTIPTEYLMANVTLESLVLAGNVLTGSLPLIRNGATLKLLDVSSNLLEGTILFENATVIESLKLAYNNFSGNLSSLLLAPKLVELDVTSNKFSGILSDTVALFEPTNLTSLKMGVNFFTGTLPSSVSFPSTLMELELNENTLGGSIPTYIGSLTELVTLNLSGCAFAGTLPMELGNLTKLETIDMYNNYLTGIIPEQLVDLVTLETLNLGKNELSGEVPSGLCVIESLQSLVVDCTEVLCQCCTTCCDEESGCTNTTAAI